MIRALSFLLCLCGRVENERLVSNQEPVVVGSHRLSVVDILCAEPVVTKPLLGIRKESMGWAVVLSVLFDLVWLALPTWGGIFSLT